MFFVLFLVPGGACDRCRHTEVTHPAQCKHTDTSSQEEGVCDRLHSSAPACVRLCLCFNSPHCLCQGSLCLRLLLFTRDFSQVKLRMNPQIPLQSSCDLCDAINISRSCFGKAVFRHQRRFYAGFSEV